MQINENNFIVNQMSKLSHTLFSVYNLKGVKSEHVQIVMINAN